MNKTLLKNTWFWLCAFVLVWCALRLFWVGADAGILSVWEYGYNVTDEGYYMGAAKDKLLRGVFNDLDCNECFTYGYSAGTHWLSYLGSLAFGLNGWGFRIPFLCLYLLGWCGVFRYVSRRSGGLSAFLTCTAFACMPIVVAYERTAGNDLVIGALTALAFCVASGKGFWRIPVAALLSGAVVLVKPSVWALLPIVLSAVLSERKTRAAWLDAVLYIVLALAAVWLCKFLAVLSVWSEAKDAGLTAFELIRRTTTHNPLPSLTDYLTFLRGFSSFPRDPTMTLVCVGTVFVSVVPLAMALRDVARRRWSWRILFNLSVPAYVAGISSLNTIYTHYFHPVLMLLPIVWVEARLALEEEDAAENRMSFARSLLPYLLGGGALVIVVLCAQDKVVPPQSLQAYYSKVYNLPSNVVWSYDGGLVILFSLLMTVLVALFSGSLKALKASWQWLLVAAVGGSVAFAGLPAVHFARWLNKSQDHYLAPVVLVLVATLVFMVTVYVLPASRFRRIALLLFPALMIVSSYVVTPSWRSAAAELVATPRHEVSDVGRQIAELIPAEAVVVGERARQTLMAQPQRTATTMPSCDPIPIVRKLFEAGNDGKVYALLDTQNAYNLQHFQKHRDEFGLQHVKTFKMPSFGTGAPCDVYLCKVIRLRTPGRPGK